MNMRDDIALTCPHCGFENMHFVGVMLTPRVHEDYPSNGMGYRGTYFGFTCDCEGCAKECVVYFQEHKGQLFAGVRAK